MEIRTSEQGIAVAKRGRRGSTAIEKNGSVTNVCAFPVQVLDTAGTGYAFDAGFISGAAQGHSIEAGTKITNATAALAVSGIGALNWRFPTRHRVTAASQATRSYSTCEQVPFSEQSTSCLSVL